MRCAWLSQCDKEGKGGRGFPSLLHTGAMGLWGASPLPVSMRLSMWSLEGIGGLRLVELGGRP